LKNRNEVEFWSGSPALPHTVSSGIRFSGVEEPAKRAKLVPDIDPMMNPITTPRMGHFKKPFAFIMTIDISKYKVLNIAVWREHQSLERV
jgi:hypothetical protein